MARVRRNPGWKQSGDVKDFLPAEIEVEAQEIEHWDGSMQHIRQIARMAASRSHFTAHLTEDKAELAATGITMALAEEPDTPVWELISRGVEAISRSQQTYLQQHGLRADGDGRTGAKFAIYWDPSRREPTHERRLDHWAVEQVWWELDEKHQQTLLGRIAAPDVEAQATQVGLSKAGVRKRIRQARQAALDLWFDWEPAPKPTPDMPRATHCTRGHDLDEHGSWMTRTGRGRTRYCLTCANDSNKRRRAA